MASEIPQRYSCNFSGECEFNASGEYPSLPSCQEECQSNAQKDTDYLIYQFNPERAYHHLSPSDQAIVLQRLTGISFPPEKAGELLLAVRTGATAEEQLNYPELRPYLERKNLLSAERLLASLGSNSKLELLRRYKYLPRQEAIKRYSEIFKVASCQLV